MVKIAYLLLCHKNVDSVVAQARALVDAGDAVAIHFDKRGAASDFAKLKAAFADEPSVAFCKRLACGWGEYSLVQASLNMLETARAAFDGVTHYYLLSGDCFPTKSSAYLKQVLAADDRDYIEINDFLESDWIKTGLKEDRLTYRHFFNEREQSRLFYGSLNLQRRFGLTRSIPKDLRVKIGSQWWLLRASTVEKMVEYMRSRPDV
ncbi:MAG: beta-1,6-N-acetylglucosaminyltransferase, partial [Pseudomonadota bacterium]